MGDVFDAMNRARREKAEQSDTKPTQGSAASRASVPPAKPAKPLNPEDDKAPALPMADVKAKSMAAEEDDPALRVGADDIIPAAPARDFTSTPVATANTKANAREAELTAKVAVAKHDPSLNGYSDKVVVHHDRGSIITEQYRAIRTQILARARNRRLQVHVITSSAPEEGKTVTSVNLGMAFSELRNQKTLLVECDLRRPSFHKLFERKCEPGLLQLLKGEIDDIDKVLHKTVYDNLQFIPAGGRNMTESTELLSSPRMLQILDRLRDRYDHIFLDTPPVITVTDPCILGALADETLLVVRLHKTPSEAVDRAKRLLRAANCDLAGVILTHMQYNVPKYLYRYA
jgi:capsular exopolysaccharide synthesis family protein